MNEKINEQVSHTLAGLPDAKHANNDIYTMTGGVGLILAIVLLLLAWWGKQYWLIAWSLCLIVASIGFIVAMWPLL